MYKIVYTKQTVKDKQNLKAAGLDTKTKELIEIIRYSPKQPPCKQLRKDFMGALSRRINLQHRLVYQVIEGAFDENEEHYDGVVKIIRMWGHYND